MIHSSNTIGLASDHGEYELREYLKEPWHLRRSPTGLLRGLGEESW
jgi:hypothetical protein